MEFENAIMEFSEKVKMNKKNCKTEEATKMALITPLFQILGYDVFNTKEFCPEYTADIGTKKGERVDYAIFKDDELAMLVECKSCTESLDTNTSIAKFASQLYRYFSTTSAKFGVLTNGLVYKFYSDIEKENVMDLDPFLEIDILNPSPSDIEELQRFCKDEFNRDDIINNATDLKCGASIKERLYKNFQNPDDDFIKLMISDFHTGVKTQKVIDRYRPNVKKAFADFVRELMTSRFNAVISAPDEPVEEAPKDDAMSKIVTTELELEAFYIIRGLLVGTVPIEDVAHRDTESYFGILYQDNNRKPICRLILSGSKPQIMIPDEDKNFKRTYIDDLNDLYKFKGKLIKVVKRYLDNATEPATPAEPVNPNQEILEN